MAQKGISPGTLKTDSGVDNRPIFVPSVLKEALWTGLWHSLMILSNLKIRLIQCYEVHWIHNVDTICNQKSEIFFCISRSLQKPIFREINEELFDYFIGKEIKVFSRMNTLCTPLVWMRIATFFTTSGYIINCSVQNFVHCTSGIYCSSWKLKELKQIKGKRTFKFHKSDPHRCVQSLLSL